MFFTERLDFDIIIDQTIFDKVLDFTDYKIKLMKIVFATGNPNKVKEVKQLLQSSKIEIVSLADIGVTEDIPETQDTIVGNAIQKAQYVRDHYGLNCFAEDTGLEIEALNGAPGVYSARYAGPEKNAQANMRLVLEQLSGIGNRKAQFKTVIALILNDNTHTFEGIIKGNIAQEPQGEGGFGYDPIFVPFNSSVSFAEMRPEDKNTISHRGIAVRQLAEFLSTLD